MKEICKFEVIPTPTKKDMNWNRESSLNSLKQKIICKGIQYFCLLNLIFFTSVPSVIAKEKQKENRGFKNELLNIKANGFKGIWYKVGSRDDQYVYKYSGGLGTYCAKHRPLAIYSATANKTFFCFGGTDNKNSTLFHNVSYFDHQTGEVANPTIVLDKKTTDAHDNPVISIDDKGYIWIFSTSHGLERPSYISRSKKPYDISEFKLINATELVKGKKEPFDNFSYAQVFYKKGKGFLAFITKYRYKHRNGEKYRCRIIGFNTSKDGKKWDEWKEIANIDNGHYQISEERDGNISIAFNYHPPVKTGSDNRTNLYYLQTTDFGETWSNAFGEKISLPITKVENKALVKNLEQDGLRCYLKDITFDVQGNPIVVVVTSKGHEPGPENGPRRWELFHFVNGGWQNHFITTSDSNYDMGSLYIENDHTWKLIAPTEAGPQLYNPGGEVVIWISNDKGLRWHKEKQITHKSKMNHTYARRPVNTNSEFYAFWADGHGRELSKSNIYFCNKEGDVFILPYQIEEGKQTVKPKLFFDN